MLLSKTIQAELVVYNWTVTGVRSRPPLSPDCYTDRDMLLVNNQNPGPEIRAKVGDTVRVIITNMSPTEALTVHYHGVKMIEQNYHDGVGGASTCNIAPLQVGFTRREMRVLRSICLAYSEFGILPCNMLLYKDWEDLSVF